LIQYILGIEVVSETTEDEAALAEGHIPTLTDGVKTAYTMLAPLKAK